MSAAEKVDIRFTKPVSVAEGRKLRDALVQREEELRNKLTVIKSTCPSRERTRDYEAWCERRRRHIKALEETIAELQFVKLWLREEDRKAYYAAGERPSNRLRAMARTVVQLEDLYATVGDYLKTDSDESFEAMQRAYTVLATDMAASVRK